VGSSASVIGRSETIALVGANSPLVFVADEPTGNLDSKTASQVFRLFEDLVAQGKTILMVTHDNDLARAVSRTIVLSDGEVIEEYLARVFPAMSDEQLIKITHRLEALKFPPGAVVIRRGAPVDRFYLITKGQVDVLIQRDEGREFVVSTMGRGQFFGEIELLHGGSAAATVRAAPEGGVEVGALDRDAFMALIAESDALREAIDKAAHEREAENIAAAPRRRAERG